MDDAVVHAVDGLAAAPEFLLVLGILAILAVVAIKVFPVWKDLKIRRIEGEEKFRREQLNIERDRELRKMSEAKMRNERDMEAAAINARAVDAQERSTAAIAALTQQMAVTNGQLEMSRKKSARMGEVVDGVAHQVDEIHGIVVRKESNHD